MLNKKFKDKILHYHEFPMPGKIGTQVLKSLESEEDLSIAYTPGVAEPILKIIEDPSNAYRYTSKGNLIAVITNGTAVLGFGNIGALASKPVMEGKAVLFKRFADVNVFDLEINASLAADFISCVAKISPTFGGINLEDIKAPECFEIEKTLQDLLDIPVFHDDQHGTAIVVGAALLNALDLKKKSLKNCKIVCVGAGAAGIASMHLLEALGAKKENMLLLDSKGVVRKDRDDLNPYKEYFAINTNKHTLRDALIDADVFIGVAKPDLLQPEDLKLMADNPIVFALSNPDPEILPEKAMQARKDLIIATGRSDYPNQVNNVLCFPYIFRGALQVQATRINQAMHIACVEAIRSLVHEDVPEEVKINYPKFKDWKFGPHYIIPKPIDPRLKERVSSAVAKAAIATGVASKK